MDWLSSFTYLFDTAVVVIEPNTLETAGLFPVNDVDMEFVEKFPNVGAPLCAGVALANDRPIADALKCINSYYG